MIKEKMTINYILDIESRIEEINNYIDKLARDVYKIRNEKELSYYFEFSNYEHYYLKDNICNDAFYIDVCFVEPRSGNSVLVTFPVSYLNTDYVTIEKNILKTKKENEEHILIKKNERIGR